MTLEIGKTADNRYRISKLLGQGGMGAVYKAWDTRLERAVALKEMIPQSSLSTEMLEQLREQFRNEAQVLGTLSHPNLVRVTDYFSWDGNEYLVMDFVEGESLADLIAREGAQNEEKVLRWATQLLDVLAYCHRRGVLHRDIKPQNIIITPDDNAVMVDFGLVKLWDPNDPQTRTVMRGAGTPEYAPPEQYDMGLGHTDPRSDIYSLGATLYHALTGKTPPTATQRMASPSSFVPPRRINAVIKPSTEAAILKAMEVAMNRRFQSAEEMARALSLSLQPPSIATRRITPRPTAVLPEMPSPAAVAQPKPKSRWWIWVTVGISVVLCLGALVVIGGITGLVYIAGLTPSTPEPGPTRTAVAVVTPPSPAPPNATLRPIRTPTLSDDNVLLQDSFDNAESGWEVGDYTDGDVGYGDGFYYVTGEKSGSMMWGVASQVFADLTIDVDATQVSAPANNNNAYGVMCRVNGNNGYIFQISGDGHYAIHRIVEGTFEELADWSPSDAIQEGNTTNHIRAVCDGSQLFLLVNGELVAQAEDSTYTTGDIALTATTFEDEATEIHYDNLLVTLPGTTPPTGATLYEDDFDDPESGWNDEEFVSGSVGYGDGYYYVTSTEKGTMNWGVAGQRFSDLVIVVDATQFSAGPDDNNAYGVMCRVQPEGDGYALRISGDGFYAIHRVMDGEFEALADWDASDAIKEGDATNHIRAVCDGPNLILFVNGELLTSVEDTTFSEGDIGLTATTFEDEATRVHFDNLAVFEPPN